MAAPDEPITADWRDNFDFGPPAVTPVNPLLRDDPEVQKAIQQSIAAGEPARRRAAVERLERAWRAPA
jgi:hypothetical protein